MAKSFPCWVCKGHGGERDIIIPETGQGPWYDCQYCEGEGMIEIGGRVHKDRYAESLGIKLLKFSGSGKEYSFDELRELGYKAMALV